MKCEAENENAVRREIDHEFSFLNDRPSLHCGIMRQIKGEDRPKKKMTVGAVLAAILMLLAFAGLAVSALNGFVFLDHQAHGQLYSCAVKDNSLYVLGQKGLWVYRPGSDQAQQLLSKEKLPRFSSPLSVELVAAEELMLIDREAQKIWILDDNGFTLKMSYANTLLDDVDDQGSEFIWQDGMLFVQSDQEGSIYRADPATGEAEKLPVDSVTRAANYQPGQLLALTYTEQQGTAVLAVDVFTGEQQELYRDAGLGVKGVSYAEGRDAIYAIVSGYLSRWDGNGWQSICGAALPQAPFFCGVFGDSYAAVNYEGVQLIPLDETEEVLETLVIQGLFDSARYDHGFQRAYPGITIARRSETEFDIAMAEAALQSGCEADLLHVRIYADSVDKLWSMIEPIRSEKLLSDAAEMMPMLQSLLLRNGQLCAVPSTMLVSAWKTSGIQRDPVPRTLQELLEGSSYWAGQEAFDGSTMNIMPWQREEYAAYLLNQAIREREAGLLRFTDSAFIDTLEALKEQRIPLHGADEAAWIYTSVSLVGYLSGSEGVIPYTLPPVISKNAAPQIPAYVTVYVLNPNSQHRETAIRYLEYLAANRFAWDDALLKPETAKPVLGEWAKNRMAQLDESDNARRKQIEDDPANWEVLEENLCFYREQIAPFVVLDDIHIQKINAIGQSMLQIFLDGLEGRMTAQECAYQLEHMAE